MPTILLSDFSGGLNTRDSPNELGLNETPSALNWTLDERGALKVRNGISAFASLPGDSTQPAYLFYSSSLKRMFVIRASGGVFLHLFSLSGTTWTDRGSIGVPAANQIPSIADWPGDTPMIVMSGGADHSGSGQGPIHSWDGTTNNVISAAATPGGWAMSLWQNRLWLGGYFDDSLTANPTTLFYSKIGDPTVWAAPDGGSVDLRDKDGERITGMGVAAGALIVFKRRSAYRVNDSSTGSYTMIDPNSGAVGPLAVVPFRGRLYTWGDDGIYEWDGVGPGRLVAERASPTILSASGQFVSDWIAGGVWQDRIVFAYTNSLTNDSLLEFSPTYGWVMNHQLGTSSKRITSFAGLVSPDTRTLYAAVADGDFTRSVFSGSVGSDAGSLMTNNYRTPWLQPAVGKLSRVVRAQIEGLLSTSSSNTLAMRVYNDWDLSTNTSYDLTTDLRGGDVNDEQEASVLHSLGHSRSFAFEFVAATAAGATAVRSLALDTLALER